MVAQPNPTPLAVLRLAIAPLPSDGEKRLAEARVPAGSTAAGARARCRGTGAWSCGGSRTPSAGRCPSPSAARGSSRWPSSSISLLCDAEIALIVFSPAGMLYEYASTRFVPINTSCLLVHPISGLGHWSVPFGGGWWF
ncbi:hypothetical protein PVAP13_7NG207900 [Panicum virgatum]|uniref:MADS-box domain-containing protein n=1 Tax=Panicum virgatum TaxID=38727 RepID=A0A8T0Q791_PANVG|nr:hypothetical protein PVAP13_7NG207900 [Panicum virgatum]